MPMFMYFIGWREFNKILLKPLFSSGLSPRIGILVPKRKLPNPQILFPKPYAKLLMSFYDFFFWRNSHLFGKGNTLQNQTLSRHRKLPGFSLKYSLFRFPEKSSPFRAPGAESLRQKISHLPRGEKGFPSARSHYVKVFSPKPYKCLCWSY